MMHQSPPRVPKGVFRSVAVLLPLILLPFSVFFFEVWVELGVYADGCESATLREEIKETRLQIHALEGQEDRLKTMERIEARAPDLGLIPPQPSQIQVVRVPKGEAPGEPPHGVTRLAVRRGQDPRRLSGISP